MNNTDERIYKIYAHVNKLNKKIYIGQTCEKYIHSRWRHGKGYIRCPYFYNAIQKYGWDGFEHIILFDNIISSNVANMIETELIEKFKTTNRNYGYNLSSGGSNGKILPEESRNKIRISKLGDKNPNYNKKPSEETRKKLSMAHSGKKQSKEWVDKRKRFGKNNGMYGKKLSEETRKKIGAKSKGGNNPSAKKCFVFSNVEDLVEFECLSYAYKTINMGTKYCRNHRLSGIHESDTNRIIYILTEKEYTDFIKWAEDNGKKINWLNIQARYDAYNEYFYNLHNEE